MDFEGTPESPRQDDGARSAGADSGIQPGMGSTSPDAFVDPAQPKAAVIPIRRESEPAPQPQDDDDDPPVPVWMQRINIVMKFLICVWLGMVVSVLPWTAAWTDNPLILSLPRLREFISMDFVKGAVTGIGLVDIWIGIWEAVHYRDQRPAPRTPAP